MDALNKVWEVQELKKMPDNAHANTLLQRLVQATSHILQQRKWTVKVLREFYPKNQSLLGMNVNGGASIMIRLRYSNDKNRFLEWHDILGTMCHELAHMAIGPHNAEFYRLWDELSDEVERAGKASFYNPSSSSNIGISSTSGIKLGGMIVHDGHKINDIAANAAIKRQRLEILSSSSSSGSGQKLGGKMIGKKLTTSQLRDMVAKAAERRLIDDLWCPTQSMSNIDPTLSSSSMTSSSSSSSMVASDRIEEAWECSICMEINPPHHLICSYCGIDAQSAYGSNHKPSSSSSSRVIYDDQKIKKKNAYDGDMNDVRICHPCIPSPPSSSSVRKLLSSSSSMKSISWQCMQCTYMNDDMNTNQCMMCGGMRMMYMEDGWICDSCTYHNKQIQDDINICDVCNQPRVMSISSAAAAVARTNIIRSDKLMSSIVDLTALSQ